MEFHFFFFCIRTLHFSSITSLDFGIKFKLLMSCIFLELTYQNEKFYRLNESNIMRRNIIFIDIHFNHSILYTNHLPTNAPPLRMFTKSDSMTILEILSMLQEHDMHQSM